MTTTLKPYPAMRDSGVPWLGKVPEHWEMRRLKWCTALNPSRTESRGSLSTDTLVTFLPMERVGADGRIDMRDRFPASAVWNGFTYFRRGDVLVAKITPCFENGKGACLDILPTEIGFGSTEFHVLRAKASVVPQFLYRLTTIPEFRRLGADAMTGAAGQQRVPQAFIGNFPIGLPPIPEQAVIVRFLDHVDRRIRRYTRAKQKLIKLLEEQKQAIIHSAVTRGLDPNVRLKPSGLEWLGDVPEHWDVLFLGRCLRQIDQGWSPVAADGEVTVDQWTVLTLSSVRRGEFIATAIKPIPPSAEVPSGIEIREGDLLLTRSNTRELVGDVCLVSGARPKTVICDLIYRLTPHTTRLDPRFLMYLLLSPLGRKQIESDARGSSGTMPKIAQRHIRRWTVLVPPLEEQRMIVEAIEQNTKTIKDAKERAQKEISLLREYRTRLIADVVTGKLDVREAAAQLPDETDEPEPLDEAEALADGEEEIEEADLGAVSEEPEA